MGLKSKILKETVLIDEADFNKVVNVLTKLKIPCNVKADLKYGSITIEFGFNWPDSLMNKCFDPIEKEIGDKINKVNFCAEESGHYDKKARINGGPKRY